MYVRLDTGKNIGIVVVGWIGIVMNYDAASPNFSIILQLVLEVAKFLTILLDGLLDERILKSPGNMPSDPITIPAGW